MEASAGLTSAQVEQAHVTHGYNEVKAAQKPEWQKILRLYTDWVCLIVLATAIISATVAVDGDRGWTSFTLLIIELQLIVWVSWYSERNAGNAIKELQELAAPTAVAKRDGSWKEVAVRELVPGDVIELKGGDVVPADARLQGKGEPLKIDESSLTGESLPVTKKPGDPVLSGAVVASGELEAVVTATGADTFFGKTISLLNAPEGKGHLQKILGRVSLVLGFVALLGSASIFGVLMGRGDATNYCIIITFVVLVSTIPIGLPVVTTTVLAVGAREMARQKAIVNRLSSLEELSGMEVLCSDKTGTLTLNRLTLDPDEVLAWGENTAQDVLLLAALSAKWENNDAIDKAVTGSIAAGRAALAGFEYLRLVPFNPVDKRTSATVRTPQGQTLVCAKGAPQVIADLLGSPEEQAAVEQYINERASRGLRSLGVAKSMDGEQSWQLVGLISLLDPPREDTAATIRRANALGVEVKMVTGDQLMIAVETSRRLGLGTTFMEGKELMQKHSSQLDFATRVLEVDGYAGVYPEHKHRIVAELQAKGRLIGMTGDGVNDAPALKKANVGIAVAGATSAAKGAADIVLTEEGLGAIVTAIISSRVIFGRLQSYVIYRFASSLLILGFFFFGIIILGLEMPTWAIIVINLTNDVSVMATSLDQVHSAEKPQIWNMTQCLLVAVATAAVGVLGAVLFLWLSLPDRVNWFDTLGTPLDNIDVGPNSTQGQVVACVFLLLMILIQLNIFATRNSSLFWRFHSRSAPPPSIFLILPVACVLIGATFVAVYWPDSVQPDGGRGILDGAGWAKVGITWAYGIVWWLAADAVKALVQRGFRTYDVIKEDAKMHNKAAPGWVNAIDWPGTKAEQLGDKLETAVAGMFHRVVQPLSCAGPKGQTKAAKPRKTDTPLEAVVIGEEAHTTRVNPRE